MKKRFSNRDVVDSGAIGDNTKYSESKDARAHNDSRESAESTIYTFMLFIAFLVVVSAYWVQRIAVGESIFPQSSLGMATVLQFSVLFVVMLVTWRFGPNTQKVSDYSGLIIIAVGVRILLLYVDPYTSNDIGRYLFDGYIAASGFDPYRISHDAMQLSEARLAWAPPQEHVQYVTLYPPLALALFSAAASVGVEYAVLMWKLMLMAAGLLSLLFVVLILKKAKKMQHLSLFALSPILIFESGIGAHLDIFSMLAVCGVIYAMQRNLLVWAALFIGLGTLVKLLPLVLAGPIVLSLRNFRQAALFSSVVVATISLGYGIAYALGLHPVGSIGNFFEKFRFSSPVFYFMEAYLPLNFVAMITGFLLVVGLLLVAGFNWKHSRRVLDGANLISLQAALCLPLLLSPVTYPWYLAPLIPLLVLSPQPFLLIWLALIPLTYEVLGGFVCCNEWNPAIWPIVMLAIGMMISVVMLVMKKPKIINDRSNGHNSFIDKRHSKRENIECSM